MLRFEPSTVLVVFSFTVQFYGDDVLCSDTSYGKALGIIPECDWGGNEVDVYLWNSDVPDGVILELDSDDIPISKTPKYTKFLIHGFASEANNTNYKALIDVLLKESDVNVFSVDWKQGACTGGLSIIELVSYPKAVLNTWEVAEKLAKFIMKLVTDYNQEFDKFIVIGHSLGAHVAGFTGKYLEDCGFGTLSYIIGLDPAGPGFLMNQCKHRLCESDAELVQVFHTSVPTGTLTSMGNMDFYFNGGLSQPGCSTLDISCSHSKAVEYLIDAVHNDTEYVGRAWNSTSSSPPKVENCTKKNCSIPGWLAFVLPARGSFYVRTNTTDDR